MSTYRDKHANRNMLRTFTLHDAMLYFSMLLNFLQITDFIWLHNHPHYQYAAIDVTFNPIIGHLACV